MAKNIKARVHGIIPRARGAVSIKCCAAVWNWDRPDNRDSSIGFRLVLSRDSFLISNFMFSGFYEGELGELEACICNAPALYSTDSPSKNYFL